MGREQDGRRTHVHLCIALLIVLGPVACTVKIVTTREKEAYRHFSRGQALLAEGNYAGSLKENETVVALVGKGPLAEDALFYAGLLYGRSPDPGDRAKSLSLLSQLATDYPKSVRAQEARILAELLAENGRLGQESTRLGEGNRKLDQENRTLAQENHKLGQERAKLSQTIERLNQVLEESRKVDLEIEKMKKGAKK